MAGAMKNMEPLRDKPPDAEEGEKSLTALSSRILISCWCFWLAEPQWQPTVGKFACSLLELAPVESRTEQGGMRVGSGNAEAQDCLITITD